MKCLFPQRDIKHDNTDLKYDLADTFILWQQIENFTLLYYPHHQGRMVLFRHKVWLGLQNERCRQSASVPFA